jgi:tRNA dimethylallyltransferase
MNIGVAKPSPEELQQVTHYFINSHSIHESVDTVVFEQTALSAAEEIFAKDDIAVVCGGTGLYVKVFCEGIDDIPRADPAVKAKVDKVFREQGVAGLQAWIAELDPLFSRSPSEMANRVRLMRAIEVKLSSGKSILDYQVGVKRERPFAIKKYGILWPRDVLYKRINQRVDQMMSQGLLAEVSSLYPFRHLKALQTVGYQEIFDHLEGSCSLDEAVDKIRQHTRNYAKRQMTWFSRDKTIQWFGYEELLEKIGNGLHLES